jgi:photosystem II stability/assembly factor-like uncharacterized protein
MKINQVTIKNKSMKKILSLTFIVFSALSLNAQWQLTSCQAGSGEIIMSIVADGNNIYTCIDLAGVKKSSDNGSSWNFANSGLAADNYNALTVSNSNVFIATDSGVFRSSDNGSTWNPANTGLTQTFAYGMAFNAGRIYASAGLGHLFYSDNEGTLWTEISNGLPTDLSYTSMIFGLGFKNSTIYAGLGAGVYKSTDLGLNWNLSSNGIVDFNVIPTFAISGNNVLAGTDNGLYISSDSGANWTPVDLGFSYISIYALKQDGAIIYMGTDKGIFKSSDNGMAWDSINTGLTDRNIQALAINDNYLFAYGRTTGIWRRPLTEVQGIDDNNSSPAPLIYPNPNHGKFTINSVNAINLIEVYNMLGEQIIAASDINPKTQKEIDISAAPKGIYFVKISDKDKTSTVKILVQ